MADSKSFNTLVILRVPNQLVSKAAKILLLALGMPNLGQKGVKKAWVWAWGIYLWYTVQCGP